MNFPTSSQSGQVDETHLQAKQQKMARGWLRLVDLVSRASTWALLGATAGTVLAVLLGTLDSSGLPGIVALGAFGVSVIVGYLRSMLRK